MKSLKSKIAIMLAFVMVFCGLSISSVSANTFIIGDVDNDGLVNVKDVYLVRAYLAKSIASTATFTNLAANVNGDTIIDAKDLFYMKEYVAEVILEFPTSYVNPDLPVGVDGRYLDQLSYEATIEGCEGYTVAINQCGYGTNNIKTAKLVCSQYNAPDNVNKLNSYINERTCYLVDTASNTAVANFASSSAGGFTKSSSLQDPAYVSSVDFSSFTTPGTYRLYTPFGYSYAFEIKSNPYQDVTNQMITALYYNRCGCDLDPAIVGTAYQHTACHLESNSSANKGKEVVIVDTYDEATGNFTANTDANGNVLTYPASDFAYGLHDAGDYGRYVTPAAQVVADMIYSYELYPSSYSLDVIQDNEGENIPDVLDEARWEAKFLLNMQSKSGPTEGGFYYKICTNKFASESGSRPENDASFNSNGFRVQHVNMESTTFAAGALASCYYAFKDLDPDFANECLAAAKKGFDYFVNNVSETTDEMTIRKGKPAEHNKGNYPVGGGAYGGNGWRPGMWYASCALYRATADTTYSDYISKIAAGTYTYGTAFGTNMTGYDMGGFGSLCYLLTNKFDTETRTISATVTSCKNAFMAAANGSVATTKSDRFNCTNGATYSWGSNAGINNTLKKDAVATYFSEVNYLDTIRYNISYQLGINVRGYSMVTGAGERSSAHIHHFPSVPIMSSNKVPCVPGFVVGGYSEENYGDYKGFRYLDVDNDCCCNEICVYWNSSPIFAFGAVVADDIAALSAV